jgi:hypothetical protein
MHRSMIFETFFFIIEAFNFINFLLSINCLSQILICCISFSFISECLLISPVISFLTKALCRNVLFAFQILVNFPDSFLLLIYILITPWAEKYCMISILLNLLGPVLCPKHEKKTAFDGWSVLCKYHLSQVGWWWCSSLPYCYWFSHHLFYKLLRKQGEIFKCSFVSNSPFNSISFSFIYFEALLVGHL